MTPDRPSSHAARIARLAAIAALPVALVLAAAPRASADDRPLGRWCSEEPDPEDRTCLDITATAIASDLVFDAIYSSKNCVVQKFTQDMMGDWILETRCENDDKPFNVKVSGRRRPDHRHALRLEHAGNLQARDPVEATDTALAHRTPRAPTWGRPVDHIPVSRVRVAVATSAWRISDSPTRKASMPARRERAAVGVGGDAALGRRDRGPAGRAAQPLADVRARSRTCAGRGC